MMVESRVNLEANQPVGSINPALREMLGHDVYDVPEDVFEEIDAAISVLCCPQCWETGLSLETIPHKPGCPLADTRVS
jgi:hypothetical protein